MAMGEMKEWIAAARDEPAEIEELEVGYEAGLVRSSLFPGRWPAFVVAALYAFAFVNLWARQPARGDRCLRRYCTRRRRRVDI